MIDVEIREANRGDLEAILALFGQPDIDDNVVLDLSAAEQMFHRFHAYPDYHLYVAVVGTEVVGTFALLIMDNLAHLGSKSGVVEDVVIRSKWRGQGVGKQMMRFAMKQCRRARCYKLTLSSSLERESAHEFYQGLGFRKHGYSFIIEF